MSAGSKVWEMFGLKAYTTTHGGARFHFHLYGIDGKLLAVMEADKLGQVRTGAASGVATRYLAREDAATVGLYGTGWQARSQLEAMARSRRLRRAVVFGRDSARRARFCREMSESLRLDVRPASTPEQVSEESDILITATNSKEPVLRGEWLRPGQHVNAIGANVATRREIDSQVVQKAARVVTDSKEQAVLECGDLIAPIAAGDLDWDDVVELGDIVSGKVAGRERATDTTLFESQGLAIEDVAVGRKVYELGRARGLGAPLPF
jgi:ornithine cyclodeaminase/alanine dehydrogenase-like protein (mu-crystallin family)